MQICTHTKGDTQKTFTYLDLGTAFFAAASAASCCFWPVVFAIATKKGGESVWFEVNTDSNRCTEFLKNETISLAKNLIFIHITASHWSYYFFPLPAFRSPQAYGLVKFVRLLGVQIVIKCGMNSGRKGDIPPHKHRLCVVVFNGAP